MGPGMGIGDVQSRDDAYNALDGLADFLMMAEPHSPVPYLLKRAVKWGRMNGQDMFRELYNNAADLNTLYRLLDIGEYDSSSPYSAPAQSYSAPVQSHPAPQQQAPASQPDAANDPYAGW
ncbi:MAG: hypothetical protein JNL32_15145, partial [Candidatus Kapabacteria bacterium]|nr:hypothetical protein [Candidatus Kapabacteria bacterium]